MQEILVNAGGRILTKAVPPPVPPLVGPLTTSPVLTMMSRRQPLKAKVIMKKRATEEEVSIKGAEVG